MRRVLPLLALLSLPFAIVPLPKPDTNEAEMKKLKGEWRLQFWLWCTGCSPSEVRFYRNKEKNLSITGDRISFFQDEKLTKTEAIVLDVNRNPNFIDFVDPLDPKKRTLAIYRIEDDYKLIIIVRKENPCERPHGPKVLSVGDILYRYDRITP